MWVLRAYGPDDKPVATIRLDITAEEMRHLIGEPVGYDSYPLDSGNWFLEYETGIRNETVLPETEFDALLAELNSDDDEKPNDALKRATERLLADFVTEEELYGPMDWKAMHDGDS